MERTEVLDMMGALKLFGMRAAYDETLAMAIKRQHEPQRSQTSLRSLRRLDCAAICSRRRSPTSAWTRPIRSGSTTPTANGRCG